MDIGFIGLGTMGSRMAANLIKGGHNLWAHDVASEALAQAADMGAIVCDTPRDAAQGRDAVFLSLTYPSVVEKVVVGENGVLSASPVPPLLVDMSTSLPTVTKRLAAAALARGCQMLDAPVTGRPEGAAAGALSILVGGPADAFEKALPLLKLLGKDIFRVGEAGAGHTMKLVNNVMTGINRTAVVEAVMMGVLAGLDPKTIYDVISVSTANSRTFAETMPRLLKGNFEPGFTVDLMHKDMDLAAQLGQEMGMPMPVLNLSKQVYQAAKQAGLGKKDTAAIATLMEKLMTTELRDRSA